MQFWNRSFALRVAVPFVLFSLAWILITDQLVARMAQTPPDSLRWQTFKGAAFVIASTLLIIFLLVRAQQQEERVRDALVHSEESLRLQSAALEAAGDAIIVTDRQGIIQWANPAFSRLTGYRREEALGKNPRDLIKSGRQTTAFYEQMWTTILGGQEWRGELVNRRKDGSLYTEALSVTPVRDGQDQITHFVAIKQDITAQLLVQRQLLRQERMAAVGQMAAGIAHDFNNIMSVIHLQTQLLQRGELPADVRERVNLIGDQSQRATTLIEQILDFSRRAVLDRQPLDLATLLRDELRLLARTLPANITLQEEIATGEYRIMADATRLQQVIMNLAFNARDAMLQGGCLHFALARAKTNGSGPAPGLKAGDWIRLTVSDSGTGIEPAALDNIFEPFFTTKAPGVGTGLGLSQVQGIVSQHGGAITVRSNVGEGTTFDIYLPALHVTTAA